MGLTPLLSQVLAGSFALFLGNPLSAERHRAWGGAPQGVGRRVLALLVISSHDPDLPGLDFLPCEMRAWDLSVLLRGRGHDPDLGKGDCLGLGHNSPRG